ncbi:MAG: alpha/beta hydrolase [Polyangiaceae bacterium]
MQDTTAETTTRGTKNIGAIARKARALFEEVAQSAPVEQLRKTLVDAFPVKHDLPLPAALQAERKTITSSRGQTISFYVDRGKHGRPLVLLHSINACASAYEMKPLFDHYRGERPVYAVELGGFGFSGRDERAYDPELYERELIDFLTRVRSQEEAADIVALSLSCEFAARVALQRPDLVNSLTFISPTGFDGAKKGHGDPPFAKLGAEKTRQAAHYWLSQVVYDAIASRRSIAYFLGKSFVGEPDEGLRDYAYTTSHQPGARFAPFAFLSGALFTKDVAELYRQVDRPVLVLYDQDGFTHFDRLDEVVAQSSRWTAVRIPNTKGMPHFERLEETTKAMDAFWTEQEHAARTHHAHGTHGHAA